MTVGLAWVEKNNKGRTHLYVASDSRTRGGLVLDYSPKILTLPRSDSAICFAGDVATTYPLMLHLYNAIANHLPAQNRSLDIEALKTHLLKVFNDTVWSIKDSIIPLSKKDFQFIFCGYSWLSKEFKIWTISFSENKKEFFARPSNNFHPKFKKFAAIGDVAPLATRKLHDALKGKGPDDKVELEPFKVLRDLLRESQSDSTIGGPPQLVRIGEHMNLGAIAVRWKNPEGEQYLSLLGRRVFDYENIDSLILDPDSCELERPRSYGYRADPS